MDKRDFIIQLEQAQLPAPSVVVWMNSLVNENVSVSGARVEAIKEALRHSLKGATTSGQIISALIPFATFVNTCR